jgi:hypothetical protein
MLNIHGIYSSKATIKNEFHYNVSECGSVRLLEFKTLVDVGNGLNRVDDMSNAHASREKASEKTQKR